jgi:hypothetical protein
MLGASVVVAVVEFVIELLHSSILSEVSMLSLPTDAKSLFRMKCGNDVMIVPKNKTIIPKAIQIIKFKFKLF